jgi:hypothetical protein
VEFLLQWLDELDDVIALIGAKLILESSAGSCVCP